MENHISVFELSGEAGDEDDSLHVLNFEKICIWKAPQTQINISSKIAKTWRIIDI